MEAITVERVRERRTTPAAAVVAYVGAAAFLVAAVWSTLVSSGVTVASEPAQNLKLSAHQNELIYLHWLIARQPQERLYTGIAIIAFLCLAATAISIRTRRGSALAALGAEAVAVGVVLWVTESVAHLGANYGIGLLTTHDYPTETISGIGFTVDMIARALEMTAFAILGLGALAFALDAFRGTPRRPRWGALGAVIGIALLVGSWSNLTGIGSLGDVLVPLVGAILLPVWMLWSAAMLRPSDREAERAR